MMSKAQTSFQNIPASLSRAQLDSILTATGTAPGDGQPRWLQAGRALADWQSFKRYKDHDHESFSAFCQTLDLPANRAYLLIGATQVATALEREANAAEAAAYVPRTEREALALVGLSRRDLPEVARLLDGTEEASLEELKEAVLEVKGSLESTPHLNTPHRNEPASSSPLASIAESSQLASIAEEEIPYFDTFQQKSHEKESAIRSKKRTVDYAQKAIREAGLRQRIVGSHMIAVEGAEDRIAYFWPVLRRWQWEGEEKRRGGTTPEEFIEAIAPAT